MKKAMRLSYHIIGMVLALIALIYAWLLFAKDTSLWGMSFFAALLTSALVWVAYEILLWFFLALFFRTKK